MMLLRTQFNISFLLLLPDHYEVYYALEFKMSRIQARYTDKFNLYFV